jgi:mRNA interferase RelE/StbE
MFKVVLSESAFNFYSNCDKILAKKLNRCFDLLSRNPYESNNINRLSGALNDYFRYRVENYRVVYKIREELKKSCYQKHRAQV